MSPELSALCAWGLSYLIGSLPFAVLVSRAMGLADPRTYGSGNPGATNVLRTGNRAAAALTLVGDAAKGAVAVALGSALDRGTGWLPIACGAAAFLGHVFPVFLRFKGGKGVATYLGVLLAFDFAVGTAICGIWLAVAIIGRYSSLASLSSALAAPAMLWLLRGAQAGTLAWVAAMSALLVWRHRSNIAKLASGQESRIGQGGRR
jgi:acyl phosphate:glycerol-3-phosphate acyltransferase